MPVTIEISFIAQSVSHIVAMGPGAPQASTDQHRIIHHIFGKVYFQQALTDRVGDPLEAIKEQ